MRFIEFDQTALEALGAVSVLMSRSPTYCQYPVACMPEWIEPAILLRQIKIFRDSAGVLAGYMTWAYLAPDVEDRFKNDPSVLLHFSEWNEGDRLWIMDFVCVNGNVRGLLREARASFPKAATAQSLRRNEDGAVRKVSTWRQKKRANGYVK
ncbi:toxin-activating lysine-acyltransferase [Luteimonas sp. RD2P54]|uniref:RTX toxin-activating lysine-acyltransferase n=1 Tax=Luteimonas endophytica TaxID=3042023 RepID=A0ABT6J4P0_9GAMM|nr:toxin-activating lysine-acyltransferase [Luteimonas endophytica]MDH5821775.1 toxin-activating lysine-acyltransferase [Luteimonas endophytica]